MSVSPISDWSDRATAPTARSHEREMYVECERDYRYNVWQNVLSPGHSLASMSPASGAMPASTSGTGSAENGVGHRRRLADSPHASQQVALGSLHTAWSNAPLVRTDEARQRPYYRPRRME